MTNKDSISPTDILLSVFAGFLIFWALRLYLFLPYTDNEGAFVLIGREMAHGAKLYADIWDHKPPFLFGQSWLLQMAFPLTEIHLHLYALFIHALDAFLIFKTAKRLEFSRQGAAASALGYGLLLFPPLFQPWAVEADILTQPFLLWSFWAAFSEKRGVQFLSGVLWACAFFTKQSALFLLPVYLAAGVFADIPKILRWAGGALLTAGVVMVPFGLDGRWMDFYAALIGFNQSYIEGGWRFFFATDAFRQFLVQWAIVAGLTYGLPLLATVLGIVGKTRQALHPRISFFLIIWFLCVLTSCCVSGYFFTYYFVTLLPPLALGMGLAWAKWRGSKRFDLMICLLLILSGAAALSANLGGARDKVFGYAQYPSPRYFADKAMGLAIAGEARPGDELLSWSDDPQLYVYSGLKPSVKTPFINHLSQMPYEAWKTFQDFKNKPPRFCVVSGSNQVLAQPEWFKTQLEAHYKMVKSMEDLELFVLKP